MFIEGPKWPFDWASVPPGREASPPLASLNMKSEPSGGVDFGVFVQESSGNCLGRHP
jgi:hypothetical protein